MSDALVTGRDLGLVICEALGIDSKDVSAIVINCHADAAATVTVHRFVRESGREALRRELRFFGLVRKNRGDSNNG